MKTISRLSVKKNVQNIKTKYNEKLRIHK